MPRRGARRAKVLIPDNFEIPYRLELPELPGDLPSPHTYRNGAFYSWRRHPRAHHRMQIPSYPVRASFRDVLIPVDDRAFEPFYAHWSNLIGRDSGVRVVIHRAPGRRVDRMMNTRMRDYKPHRYLSRDGSRAGALEALGYRSGKIQALHDAFTQSATLAADSAIALYNGWRLR